MSFKNISVNEVIVNSAKTQVITFTSKRPKSTDQVIMAGQNIPRISTVKYCDIQLDIKITWVLAITKRTNLTYPALYRLYPLFSRNSKFKIRIKINLYKSCVKPIITYNH